MLVYLFNTLDQNKRNLTEKKTNGQHFRMEREYQRIPQGRPYAGDVIGLCYVSSSIKFKISGFVHIKRGPIILLYIKSILNKANKTACC